ERLSVRGRATYSGSTLCGPLGGGFLLCAGVSAQRVRECDRGGRRQGFAFAPRFVGVVSELGACRRQVPGELGAPPAGARDDDAERLEQEPVGGGTELQRTTRVAAARGGHGDALELDNCLDSLADRPVGVDRSEVAVEGEVEVAGEKRAVGE